jgi:hypothetical protein
MSRMRVEIGWNFEDNEDIIVSTLKWGWEWGNLHSYVSTLHCPKRGTIIFSPFFEFCCNWN